MHTQFSTDCYREIYVIQSTATSYLQTTVLYRGGLGETEKRNHLSQENHVALKEDLVKTLKLKFIFLLNPILFFQKWSAL